MEGELGELKFGTFLPPIIIKTDKVNISIIEENGGYVYKRYGLGEEVEKAILSHEGKLRLVPTEPLNKPKFITPYLLIEFNRPVILDPKAVSLIYLTFPVEIACCFLEEENDEKSVLDIISMSMPKYTLYGSISRGFVCKYHKSSVNFSMPETDPLREGIMGLSIRNSFNSQVEIKKVVFSAYDMKIFYNTGLVYLNAFMKIINEYMAETYFSSESIEYDMLRGTEIFSARRLSFGAGLVMEEGF